MNREVGAWEDRLHGSRRPRSAVRGARALPPVRPPRLRQGGHRN